MDKCISGNKIANRIKKELKEKISHIDREIIFSIIYVGDDSVIDNFIRYKKKFGEDIGVSVKIHRFSDEIEKDILISKIQEASNNSDGIIVQLPLPDRFDTQEILNFVPLEKDVDVLSEEAKKSFSIGEDLMIPPVTGSIIEVLKEINFSLRGKNIVIVGYGNLVGKPFGSWLLKNNISFQVIDQKTDEEVKKNILKDADVVVSGVGSPNLIKDYMIKEGVILIDGGTTEAGKKVVGDIDKNCHNRSLFYTPVPGGIGPITIAILYRNIINSLKRRGDK